MSVTFTLDGREVTAEAGLSIWEIANGRGLIIPHLCHKPAPGYRPDGNCRACVVEVEGERVLAASCIQAGKIADSAAGRQPRRDAGQSRCLHFLRALRAGLP